MGGALYAEVPCSPEIIILCSLRVIFSQEIQAIFHIENLTGLDPAFL